MSKIVKSVSFNTNLEEDQKILSFLESQNFSGYVKELILSDIAKRNRPLQVAQRTERGGIKLVILPSPSQPDYDTVTRNHMVNDVSITIGGC